ncbi:DUF6268 family outer membrane beta-barrel protein [Parashewanella spongiae]|uniref:DUF6268 family outer membrane beta-barrel protein n=1 Tax=Parashewanella spongiae TaxID=342950 RepID=UPI0035D8108B
MLIEPWTRIKRIRTSINLTYFYNRNWLFTLTPQVKTAFTSNLSSADAYSYGATLIGMYRFDNNNLLGLGVLYSNDLSKVRTLPFIYLNWNFNDKWSIRNPFQSNFSGPRRYRVAVQTQRKSFARYRGNSKKRKVYNF